MHPRTTLILVALLLGLGAYVYWVEMPEAAREAKKKTVLDFKPDDITQIALAYADRQIVLDKSGDQWRLTKPVEALADQVAVKNLLTAIAEGEVKKELNDAPANATQYGLDQPLVTITLAAKDKQLPAIRVGKTAPVGMSAYVQRADNNAVLLTSSAFRSGMDKQAKDLRDKAILDIPEAEVHRVDIHGPDKDIQLARTDDSWQIQRPAPYPADPTTVRSFLSTLRTMRAVDFPAEQPADLATYGLDQPRLTLTVYLGKEEAEKRVLIGKEAEKNEVYVQTSGRPTVYTVSDFVFRDLNKGVADLRDKTVLHFEPDQATAISIVRQDGTQIKLVRGDDKQWRVDGVEGKPAQSVLTSYVSDLHDLKGYEIAADAPAEVAGFGLDQPLLRLSIAGKDGVAIGTVLIGVHDNEGKKDYFTMTAGGSTVLRIRDYLVTRLNKQPQDFLEKPTPTGTAAVPPNPPAGDAVDLPDDTLEGDEGD